MLSTILNDNHPSRSAFASCIEQYLHCPVQPIHFIKHQFLPILNITMQMAIEELTQIGWVQLLLGYMSKKWLLLTLMDTPKIGQLNLSAGWSRKYSALNVMTFMVRELWFYSQFSCMMNRCKVAQSKKKCWLFRIHCNCSTMIHQIVISIHMNWIIAWYQFCSSMVMVLWPLWSSRPRFRLPLSYHSTHCGVAHHWFTA